MSTSKMSKLKNSYVLLLHLQDTCVNKMSVIDVSNGDSYYQAKRASEVYFDTYIHTIKFPPMADDFQKMAQAGAGTGCSVRPGPPSCAVNRCRT